MNKTPDDIRGLVDAQLASMKDGHARNLLQKFLVSPTQHLREWDYGKEGEHYPCWTIAVHSEAETAIVYSDYGFGPRMPWGLVWTKNNWFGMDSGWFETLEEAFRDSVVWEDNKFSSTSESVG